MGSNPENPLSTPVAKLYEHVTKSRKDFFWKWAHYLCNQADSILAEALNLKALGRGQLARFGLDAAWGEFLCFGVAQHKSILSWVCFKRGKYEACSRGQTDQSNLSPLWCPYGEKAAFSKTHSCPHCSYKIHRDVAAAQVVWNRGVASMSTTRRKNAR